MLVVWRRFLSSQPESTQAVSNVKWKLQQYAETGKFRKLSVNELKRKRDRAKQSSVRLSFQEGISPQKALILLKSRYDNAIITDELGRTVDLHALSPKNLLINDPKLLQLFQGLLKIKKIQKRSIDDRIIMTLTGVNRNLLRDSYFVARDVQQLLERDNDITRAMEVCRLAKKEGAVAINAIIEWCLKRSKTDLAHKVLVNRGKWGIPLTPYTYVIYFSGLSDSHEWGLVPSRLGRDAIDRFKTNKTIQNVETFNAALKLLMKDYSNDQALAWEFFDTLDVIKIRPDAQTFTIFLQGLKAHFKRNVAKIQKNSNLSSKERTQKLFDLQAILIQRANMVLEKAMTFATPPKPPSEDGATIDPGIMTEYKRKIKIPILDIDRHFAVAFLLCYSDNSAGTSWSNTTGSHYWYLQQVVLYLQAWMPEVVDMVKFSMPSLSQSEKKEDTISDETGKLFIVKPSPEIQRKTDKRVQDAEVPENVLPQNISEVKLLSQLNPWVPFPPSPFSNRRDKRYNTGVSRQLIDFARVKFADLRNEFREHLYHRGMRPESPWKKKTGFKRENQGINKFLLRIYLDCLLKLGLYDEFYKSMWLSILIWGKIDFDLARLRGGKPLQVRAISEDMYPVVESLSIEKNDLGFYKLDAQLDVIDIGIVEDFIHKIEEHMPLSLNPTSFALEVLAAFSNRKINVERELRPRPGTFNAIFAMLNRDIYRYNDRNVTMGFQESKKKKTANNTARLSMTYDQLVQFLDSLDLLVRCIFARFRGKSIDSMFLQSFNNLVLRVYSMTWDGAPDSHVNAVTIHKKIIRCGILMYRPNHLIDRREEYSYSDLISKSMNFVHDNLKERNDLLGEEVDLMMSLRKLFNFEKDKDHSESKYDDLQMSIYKLTGNSYSATKGEKLKIAKNVPKTEIDEKVEMKLK